MIKKVNYKPNRCLYIDLEVGETFRYGEDEVGEIIYLSKSPDGQHRPHREPQ